MSDPSRDTFRSMATELATRALDDMETDGPTDHNAALLNAAIPLALLAVADSIDRLTRAVTHGTSGRPPETRW